MYRTIYGIAKDVRFCGINDTVGFSIEGRSYCVSREYFFGHMMAKILA